VADYVAERLIERQQVIEGDRPRDAERRSDALRGATRIANLQRAALFAAGVLAGGMAMLVWAWLAA
jgi:hypothetical protein